MFNILSLREFSKLQRRALAEAKLNLILEKWLISVIIKNNGVQILNLFAVGHAVKVFIL